MSVVDGRMVRRRKSHSVSKKRLPSANQIDKSMGVTAIRNRPLIAFLDRILTASAKARNDDVFCMRAPLQPAKTGLLYVLYCTVRSTVPYPTLVHTGRRVLAGGFPCVSRQVVICTASPRHAAQVLPMGVEKPVAMATHGQRPSPDPALQRQTKITMHATAVA
jgi:hypothetical protein